MKADFDNAKSFYKKAFYEITSIKKYNTEGYCLYDGMHQIDLYSYNTLVCTIYKNDVYKNSDFYMIYSFSKNIYTHTTARHIKEFLKQFYNNEVIKPQLLKDNYHKMTLAKYNMMY